MAYESLPKLKAGELGEVDRVDNGKAIAKRLADLGFVRGAQVTMIRPGVPCIVRIDGRCLGLGAGPQECIRIAHAAIA